MTRINRLGGRFTGRLFRHPGPGGWHFVAVPERFAPPATHAWGRTPVRATVDGRSWDTSVWKDTRSKRTLLAVPKPIVPGFPLHDELELLAEAGLRPREVLAAATIDPARVMGLSGGMGTNATRWTACSAGRPSRPPLLSRQSGSAGK